MLKSWSKKKKNEMVGRSKVTKPDIDNLIKTVLDACNGHVWKDDNQITEITSSKRYGIGAENNHTNRRNIKKWSRKNGEKSKNCNNKR